MTINESYKCPVCGNIGKVVGVQPLVENVRFDTVECDCGAVWRAYYSVKDVVTELVKVPTPATNVEETADETTEEK